MFQTKRFTSIVASMVNRMRVGTSRVTDYSEGSVVRTMLESTAQEVDELYQQMVAAIVEAVPVATYRSFSFGALPAVAAGGLVRVTVTPGPAAAVVPAGTLFAQALNSVVYANTLDCVIPAGASVADVPVVATTTGSAGNLPAEVSFTLSQPPAGLVSAVNLTAWIGGRDQETDAEQKTRFNDFIETLPRGTLAALRYAAKDDAFLTDAAGNITERVAFVATNEPYLSDATQPVGWVQVFIHNGTGATSAALVARTATILYGYHDAAGNPVPGFKAAGVRTDVAAATEEPVSFTAVLSGSLGPATASAGAAVQVATLLPTVQTVIATYILGLDIGETCVKARLIELVMEVAGVTNFVIGDPFVDVTAASSVKLMPGVIGLA